MSKIVVRDDKGNEGTIRLTVRENGVDRVLDILDLSVDVQVPIPAPVPIPVPVPTPTPVPVPVPVPVPSGKFEAPLLVKEVAGVGASNFPVSAIVPLPFGKFKDVSGLTLQNGAGVAVPAQFELVNKHFAKDGSLRHVAVHFAPSPAKFAGPGTGTAQYFVREGVKGTHSTPVAVVETAASVTLFSGASRVVVEKSPLRIVFPTGALDGSLYLAGGAVQKSFSRSDIAIEVEERGPLRAVVKVSAPTVRASGALVHGWAIRIYMYAGQTFAKVDFQLQNCDLTQQFSGPLNFDGYELSLPAAGVAAEIKTASPVTVDPTTLPLGVLGATNAWGVVRNFQQMWPCGIRTTGTSMSFDLWPRWGAQYTGGVVRSDLYSLDDMQCVVKEVLIGLTATPSGLADLAKTFQFPPVAVLSRDVYEATGVTLDLGGAFPKSGALASDRRVPDYSRYSAQTSAPTMSQKLGWNIFGCDVTRRVGPATAGGWPYSVSKFFLSGDPADFYYAQDFAMGELNAMPEWLVGYNYAKDFARIKPTENPYQGFSWRFFDGVVGYNPIAGYPAGMIQETKPRDDEHGWFYHVEEAYLMSGNLWIKDWYKGIAEFRKTRLNNKDPWPDNSGRAVGHSLSHALQAYRVTGDPEILALFGAYVKNVLAPMVDPVLGGYKDRADYPQGEAMFQIGYLTRSLLNYLAELPQKDTLAYDIVSGFVRWNLTNSRYGYYQKLNVVNEVSDATSMSVLDAVAWFVMQGGPQADAVRQQLVQYITTGLGLNGQKPYVNGLDWQGDFIGRLVTVLRLSRGGTL